MSAINPLGIHAYPDLKFSYIQKSLDVDKGLLSDHLKRLEEKGLIYKLKRGVCRLVMLLLGKHL